MPENAETFEWKTGEYSHGFLRFFELEGQAY